MEHLIGHLIDSPIYRLDNFEDEFLFFDAQDAPAVSPILMTEGWEPAINVYGTFVGSLVIKTSPDGANFIPVLTVTTPGLLGRNDLKFPAAAMQLEVTSISSGDISAKFYAERRHR